MIYRKLNLDLEYDTLCKFWIKSKMGVAPSRDMLTRNGIAMYTDKEKLVGAVFQFYILDSLSVLIGYPIIDPDFQEGRSEAIDELYRVAEITAEYNGYRIAQTFSNIPAVHNRLENNGWAKGDATMEHYLKYL